MATDVAYSPPTLHSYTSGFSKTVEEIAELAEDAPIFSFFQSVAQHLFTWQLYTLTLMGLANPGPRKRQQEMVLSQREEDGSTKRMYGLSGCLFNPHSPYFNELDAKLIYLTDAALLVTFTLLYHVGKTYGWGNLVLWYCVPYILINASVSKLPFSLPKTLAHGSTFFIVSLQHLDPSMPRYTPETWTFIRGAASTIDRDFGFIGHHFWYDANETDVLYHHIPTIPHYHAVKTTDAIKPIIGGNYHKNEAGIWNTRDTYIKMARTCWWVASSASSVGMGRIVMFFGGAGCGGKATLRGF